MSDFHERLAKSVQHFHGKPDKDVIAYAKTKHDQAVSQLRDNVKNLSGTNLMALGLVLGDEDSNLGDLPPGLQRAVKDLALYAMQDVIITLHEKGEMPIS